MEDKQILYGKGLFLVCDPITVKSCRAPMGLSVLSVDGSFSYCVSHVSWVSQSCRCVTGIVGVSDVVGATVMPLCSRLCLKCCCVSGIVGVSNVPGVTVMCCGRPAHRTRHQLLLAQVFGCGRNTWIVSRRPQPVPNTLESRY